MEKVSLYCSISLVVCDYDNSVISDSYCIRVGVGSASHSAQISYNRTVAVSFILEMFSIAVERLCHLTIVCDWKNPQIDFLAAGVLVSSVSRMNL
jgi:hypothetical protein